MYFQILCAVLISLLGGTAAQTDNPICGQVPPGESFLYPYPGDCSKYYRCDDNGTHVEVCGDGLWFNQALQSCDLPERSGCVNEPATTVGPTSPGVDPRCDGNEVDYFPHPTDCTKYIECNNGTSFVMDCPDGYWFNARLKRCEEPESSGCTPGGITPTDEPTRPPSTPTEPPSTPTQPPTTPGDGSVICKGNSPDDTILKPVQGNCNKFWQCVGNHPTLMSCPPYLEFNPPKQICDWPDQVDCDGTTATPPPTMDPTAPTTTPGPTQTPPNGIEDPRCVDGNITYWPHPSDCTKYIECYNYLAYEMNCPAGLFFDASDAKCVDPQNSGCGSSSNSTPPVTHTPTQPTATPTMTTADPGTPTRDPDCPVDNDGKRYLFPYDGDCTKFWECYNGQKLERSCPGGLWFNPVLLVCDYPEDSGCVM